MIIFITAMVVLSFWLAIWKGFLSATRKSTPTPKRDILRIHLFILWFLSQRETVFYTQKEILLISTTMTSIKWRYPYDSLFSLSLDLFKKNKKIKRISMHHFPYKTYASLARFFTTFWKKKSYHFNFRVKKMKKKWFEKLKKWPKNDKNKNIPSLRLGILVQTCSLIWLLVSVTSKRFARVALLLHIIKYDTRHQRVQKKGKEIAPMTPPRCGDKRSALQPGRSLGRPSPERTSSRRSQRRAAAEKSRRLRPPRAADPLKSFQGKGTWLRESSRPSLAELVPLSPPCWPRVKRCARCMGIYVYYYML